MVVSRECTSSFFLFPSFFSFSNIFLCMHVFAGITLRALETMLGVDGNDLAKHLTPMIRGKYNLIDDGYGNELTKGLVESTSTLRINTNFTCSKYLTPHPIPPTHTPNIFEIDRLALLF
jgi:hypothetical protein